MNRENLKEEKELKGQLSQEQIESLKRKHGEIFAVEVEDCVCYLKKPDRQTLKAYFNALKQDFIAASEIMLDNCLVAGDESVRTNNDKFLAVTQVLDNLIAIKQAELKKL
jgi:hypothetical protein